MEFQTLVIGGGIAGITAAIELAETGRKVALVEKDAYLGGNVAKLNNYFPKLCPPSCGLEINYRRIRSNPRISCYTGVEVNKIDGQQGDFTVLAMQAPQMINERCTSCGKCADLCPTEPLKAAFIKEGLSYPAKYTIDPSTCLGDSCSRCVEVCEYDAINLAAKESSLELKAESVIVATGWESYDAGRIENFIYEGEPDVLTNMGFEALMAEHSAKGEKLVRPSDGKEPERVAFVQCAGSRDVKHLPYCSAVCCAASVKHALTLAAQNPKIQTEIFYIDLRLPGRNENLLNKAEEAPSVKLTKGKVGRLEKSGNNIILEVEDIQAGRKERSAFDMVILATGMLPSKSLPGLDINVEGFLEAGQKKGIYPAATCKRPMDVSASVKDATAAALKSMRREHE